MTGQVLFKSVLVVVVLECVLIRTGMCFYYRQAHAHFGDGCERVRRCCAQVYNGDHGREQLPEQAKQPEFKFAVCEMKPNPSKKDLKDNVTGEVHFRQWGEDSRVQIAIQLEGFDIYDGNLYHGFHIHALGSIADGCEASGSHYNPFLTLHGSPLNDKDNRHVGDLGNILESADGTVYTHFSDDIVSLSGPYNVMGRAVVVHQKKDDLGRGGDEESTKTGNAGARIACCVIAAAGGEFWGAH